ncbi:hypothetical protein Droror1_Dr00007149 [Drosera rotundifolia]
MERAAMGVWWCAVGASAIFGGDGAWEDDGEGDLWIRNHISVYGACAGVRVYTSIYKPKRQFASKATYGRTCSMKIASHGTVMGPSLCNPNSSSAASRRSLKTSFLRYDNGIMNRL